MGNGNNALARFAELLDVAEAMGIIGSEDDADSALAKLDELREDDNGL